VTKRTTSAALAAALTGLVLSIAWVRSTPTAAGTRSGATHFPDVTLTTHQGKDVKFYDLIKGKIVAVNVIYTNCQYACPIETRGSHECSSYSAIAWGGRSCSFLSLSIRTTIRPRC
jgi:cytochrome oxidase Cu insertion factor (SCO1/SenC/PrrC family)